MLKITFSTRCINITMNTKIYTIYRATNIINGKVYIGFDSNWPKRMSEHIWAALRGDQLVFYNAIRKYGTNNFVWDILYQSTDGSHTKDIMEGIFIKEYNSHIHFENSNGYNMTLGGDGTLGYNHLQITKDKIKEFNIGKKASEGTCEKISNSKKGKTLKHSGSFQPGHTPWCKGKKMSVEFSNNCSVGQQKRFESAEERNKLNQARIKGRAAHKEKAKIKIVFPDGKIEIMTPADFSKKYNFNERTVYWNLKKYKGNLIPSGKLAGFTLASKS